MLLTMDNTMVSEEEATNQEGVLGRGKLEREIWVFPAVGERGR